MMNREDLVHPLRRSSAISRWVGALLLIALVGSTGCALGEDADADETPTSPTGNSADGAPAVVRADHLWYTCHTAVVSGTTTWHYDSAPFNVVRAPYTRVRVSHTTPAGRVDDGWVDLEYRGDGLYDSGDNRLAMRFVPRVGNGPTADYQPSIRVFHGSINLLASGENGWCSIDSKDERGTACANPYQRYACNWQGCSCLDAGATPEDAFGNFLIDTIAGSAAGALRNLGRAGLASIVSLGARSVGAAGEDLIVAEVSATAGNLGKYFASKYVARVNFLVEAELKTVRQPVLAKLLQLGDGAAAGKTVDIVGDVGAQTVTLGEARAFTQQTSREVGLVYNTTRRRLKLVFGTKSNMGRAMALDEELLWHTHPSGLPPSLQDGLVLRTRNYDTSFVIPARGNSADAIFQYWPEPPTP